MRFVAVGGTNTACTSVAFYLLAGALPTWLAFTLVYLSGVAFTIAVTPRFVFAAQVSRRRRLLLALWYVATYLVGVGVISLLESEVSVSRAVVVIGTVGITAPLSFVGARLLVRGGGAA